MSVVIENNQVKSDEAYKLNCYLLTMKPNERTKFVTKVITAFGCPRHTFYNWKYMNCRIPDKAKEIIESVAGAPVFSMIYFV